MWFWTLTNHTPGSWVWMGKVCFQRCCSVSKFQSCLFCNVEFFLHGRNSVLTEHCCFFNESTNELGSCSGRKKWLQLTLMHQVGSPTELLPARSKVKSSFPKQKYHKMLRKSFLASLCVFPFQNLTFGSTKFFDAKVKFLCPGTSKMHLSESFLKQSLRKPFVLP